MRVMQSLMLATGRPVKAFTSCALTWRVRLRIWSPTMGILSGRGDGRETAMYNKKTITSPAPFAENPCRVALRCIGFPFRTKLEQSMAAASDKAYEILKQRVVAGSYAPGAQLKEEHIARELDISRTPI